MGLCVSLPKGWYMASFGHTVKHYLIIGTSRVEWRKCKFLKGTTQNQFSGLQQA